jgi:hypothetical protein
VNPWRVRLDGGVCWHESSFTRLQGTSRSQHSATILALLQVLEDAERSGLIQDDSSALVKICEQLASLPGQMVAEIELKRFLGLHDTRGHRAWRALRDKLLRGGFVAEVPATVEVWPVSLTLRRALHDDTDSKVTAFSRHRV